MAKKPIEIDLINGLRDVRAHLATLNRTLLALAEKMDSRFDILEADNTKYREMRLAEEVEQLEIAHKKKLSLLEQQKNNGNTTSKMKAIATEQIKADLETRKIDWGKIVRNNIIPALLTTLVITITLATLAILAPGLIQIIQKAFIR